MAWRPWLGAVALAGLLLAAPPLIAARALSPGALDAGALDALIPPCPARLAGGSCSLCGMSHGFSAMARGELQAAQSYNSNAPWLFGATLLVALGSLGALGALALRGLRPRWGSGAAL